MRIWIAVGPVTAAPALAWRLDNQPVQPHAVVQPMESARTAGQVAAHQSRTFTGVFDFTAPAALPHVIEVTANGERESLTVRSLPEAVPGANMSREALRILLVSCFDDETDPRGRHVGRYAADFLKTQRPDLALFLGDQVYLDLPISKTPDPNEPAIAADLENKYVRNWFAPSRQAFQRGYYEVLSCAPAAFAPDDHEYWNNYPHFQVQLKNTHTPARIRAWTSAAVRMWSVFQKEHGVAPGDAYRIEHIAPLSILVVDTRTERRNRRLFTARAETVIREWAEDLAASPDGVGILVSGQSIFDEKTLMGTITDQNLLNYEKDYRVLVDAVKRATSARPVLCVTGDVHWGRVLAESGARDSGRLFEVISSPSSLVNNPISNFTSRFRFGEEPPWPKHSDAPDKPQHFKAFGPREFEPVHRQRGNHIVLLSLTRVGASVQVEAQFKPMHPTRTMQVEKVSFTLR